MSTLKKLLAIDRRIIFLIIFIAIIISLLFPMGLAPANTPPVGSIYDKIDSLPPGSTVLISNDYDPSSQPELYPMTYALFYHCFKKDIKIVTMTLWVTGEGLITDTLSDVLNEKEFKDKKEGVDYVFLGAKSGANAVINQMGKDIKAAFPSDHNKTPLAELPLMKNITTLKDFDYVVSISAGVPGIDTWVIFGSEFFREKKPDKLEFGGGCTGVMATQYYPYLNSGQMNGLMGGMKGGIEYESRLGLKTEELDQMDAQSTTHLLIILFVVLGNIAYFLTRRSKT